MEFFLNGNSEESISSVSVLILRVEIVNVALTNVRREKTVTAKIGYRTTYDTHATKY